MNNNWVQKISTDQQKKLIILRGPSGSGKSRLSSELSKKYNVPVFSSDDFFTQNGQYQFDPKKLGMAHEWNQNRAKSAIESGQPVVIVDNTNTQFWEMRNYVENGVKNGYEVSFMEPNWHPELKTQDNKWNVDFLTKQQANPDRSSQNKTLPREIVERMVSRYEYDPTVDKILQSKR